MAEKSSKTQIAIIGAGPGGYAAAFRAADLGMEVALIDPRENPGGVCLYHGCIPTKALLHFADIREDAESAKQMGLKFEDVRVDVDALRKWKGQVVGQLTRGLGQLTKRRKIRYIRAKAAFSGSHSLELTDADGKKSSLEFSHAIVATGTRPKELPGVAFDHELILDATSALELKEVPDKLLIVGAGYIGLEMGVIYQALGSDVSFVEATPDIMPGADAALVDVIRKERKDLLKGARFNTMVADVKKKKGKLSVELENKDGKKERVTADKMLVAIGMQPNSGGIGLERVNISTGEQGFVSVNEYRQTSQEHIYAIGDLSGEPLLAHKASHEGRVAAEHIAGEKTAYEPKAIPSVVFVGIAWTGLTEEMARKKGRDIKISSFPWGASGRAATMGVKHGITRLVIDPKTDRVLGAGFAGKNAESLIAEAALAIEMGAVAKDLELTIHPHPTLSETIMEAAEMYYGQATHAMKKG